MPWAARCSTVALQVVDGDRDVVVAVADVVGVDAVVVGELEAVGVAWQAHEDVDRLVADRLAAALLEPERLVEGDRAVDVADAVTGVDQFARRRWLPYEHGHRDAKHARGLRVREAGVAPPRDRRFGDQGRCARARGGAARRAHRRDPGGQRGRRRGGHRRRPRRRPARPAHADAGADRGDGRGRARDHRAARSRRRGPRGAHARVRGGAAQGARAARASSASSTRRART